MFKTLEKSIVTCCGDKKNVGKSDINLIVGRYLNQTRRCSGMTGEEIGDLLGISQQQVSRYERGETRISVNYIFNYADLLGLSLFDLVYYIEKELNKNGYIEKKFY